MPQINVPTKQSENLRRQEFEWPAGAFTGTIESADVRGLQQNKDGGPFGGYTSTEGEEINVMVGQNVSADGAAVDLGKRKQFIKITTVDGQHTIFDPLDELYAANAVQLAASQKLVANLANALGAAQIVNGTTTVDGAFLGALKEGAYNGTRITYVIYHRAWTSKKSGKSGTAVEFETFAPAA